MGYMELVLSFKLLSEVRYIDNKQCLVHYGSLDMYVDRDL